MAAENSAGILFTGDSRTSQVEFTGDDHFSCSYLSMPGAETSAILEKADVHLRQHPEIKIVVIVALHCDLTEMRRYMSDGKKGLLTTKTGLDSTRLEGLITGYDYAWRMELGLSVFWALPYEIDILLYNQRRAKTLNKGKLCEYAKLDSGY
ncbi:MAG: hypothetical protein AAGM67_09575, partial [Bacteroidota bacterium]